ncbi:putative Signal transduction histidine kinase [Desulfamplus magnetovallimortis]|uniref:Putative Signal transduction histidine kinase n=2 Tax=Desulfamplus magnetovallimortis TaxID=1246637 RepID=A0A1W1HIZ9_9BACT|nr:putative Signal transduction histidine kinase [Desulfamplus magnetovallimortis]
MSKTSAGSRAGLQFSELRQKASKILEQLGNPRIKDDDMDRKYLLEELNVFQIELELQHEELQTARDQLEASRNYLNDLYAYAPIGYIVMTVDGRIEDINERAATYFLASRKILKGQRFQSFIPHESIVEYNRCLTKLMESNHPQHSEVMLRVHGRGTFWARVDMFLIKKTTGSGSMILCSILDVSKEKQIEKEIKELNHNLENLVNERTRELQEANLMMAQEVEDRKNAEEKAKVYAETQKTLLREVNHRVKNNMQIMLSLMKLQTKQTEDPDALAALMESQNRIRALAIIHDILYMSEDLKSISLQKYMSKLSRHIAIAYGVGNKGILLKSEIDIPTIHMDKAVPIGLVVSELITNSIKHAFPDGREGTISISVIPIVDNGKERVQLTVIDDGIGISDELLSVDSRRLGLRLVHRLVEEQLNGSVCFKNTNGTEVVIILPYDKNI